jgi:hypothetical protein
MKHHHKNGGDRIGRALRTETPINNSHDLGIGRRENLPQLKEIGFATLRLAG